MRPNSASLPPLRRALRLPTWCAASAGLLLALLGVLAAADGGDGNLDPTFGSAGVSTIGGGEAWGVVAQPGGKTVVAGSLATGATLWRFAPNGAGDSTFGDPLGGGSYRVVGGNGRAVLQRTDGRLLMLMPAYPTLRAAQVSADGVPDPTFGTNGIADLSFNAVFAGAVLQPDGKIVVAGYLTNGSPDVPLYRYNPDGSPDLTFGVGGKTVATHAPGGGFQATSLTLQEDGKILVAGGESSAAPGASFLIRFTDTGTLDPTFGAGGIVTTLVSNSSNVFQTVTVQPDGKIIAGGWALVPPSPPSFRASLVRYNPDGTLDGTFGSGGIVLRVYGGTHDEFRALLVQDDGKIIGTGFAAGSLVTPGLIMQFARFNADGTSDTSFGFNGVTYASAGQECESNALIRLENGKLMAVGDSTGGNGRGKAWIMTRLTGPAPTPPVARADAYAGPKDAAVTVSAPGVLQNDTALGAWALRAVLVSGPAHGTLSLSRSGAFTYTPAAGYVGTDSFTYVASDGIYQSAPVTVTLDLVDPNHPPAAADDAYSTPQDTPLVVAAPGVLQNDTDTDGDLLTTALVSGPAHGTLDFSASGSFTYTPTAGYHGPDQFTYRASDAKTTSAPATVRLTVTTVNHPPTAAADSYTATQDTPLTISAPGVLQNDADPDGDPLSASLGATPAHGSVTLNADGSFTYTPAAGYHGPDQFTYRASDGALSSGLATVSLQVNAVNRPPTAQDDAFTVAAGATLLIPAPGLLGNDADPDGNPLAAVLVTNAMQGNLTLNANGSFTYVPNLTFTGTDHFTYRASDGAAQSNVATVTLTVTASNHAPVANAESYSTPQDTPLPISAPGVLQNDTDADGDALSAQLVSGPAHGALTLNGDGSFTYTPAAGYHGGDSFTYRASDGQGQSAPAAVSITVAAVNHPPSAAADAYSTPQEAPLTVAAPGVLANDTDPDGDRLTARVLALPAHGTLALSADGSFTYTPRAGFSGTDSFTYEATDGSLPRSATVTLTVTHVNHAPVAVNDAYTVRQGIDLFVDGTSRVVLNDTDPDGDPLTAQLVAPTTHGTMQLNADGSFNYTPLPTFTGTDSFTYRAFDGQSLSVPATVQIEVSPGFPASTPFAKVNGFGAAAAGSGPLTRFELEASVTQRGAPKGHFTWRLGSRDAFHSRQITAVVIAGTHARIWGKGLVGTTLTDFVVDVDDLGPASQHKDRIQVLIGASGFGPGTMQNGDIKVTSPRR